MTATGWACQFRAPSERPESTPSGLPVQVPSIRFYPPISFVFPSRPSISRPSYLEQTSRLCRLGTEISTPTPLQRCRASSAGPAPISSSAPAYRYMARQRVMLPQPLPWPVEQVNPALLLRIVRVFDL